MTANSVTGRRFLSLWLPRLPTDRIKRQSARSGAPVRQIETHGLCHLEAAMVEERLAGWDVAALEILFIENVGNLVCPTSWDLGESLRVALLSVTEGEDKPLKYPGLFNTSDIAVITKVDHDSDAAEKGLQPGDVVLRVGNKIVRTPTDFQSGVAEAKKGGRSSVLLLVAHSQGGTGFVAIDIDKA